MNHMKRKWQWLLVLIAGIVLLGLPGLAAVTKASEEPTVYLDMANGSDENGGTADAPVKTLEKAYALLDSSEDEDTVSDGGNVKIVGGFTLDGTVFFPESAGKVTVSAMDTATGGSDVATVTVTGENPQWYFLSETELNNITVNFTGTGTFEINTGDDLIVGDNVTFLRNGQTVAAGDNSIGIRLGGETALIAGETILEGYADVTQTRVITSPIDYSAKETLHDFLNYATPFALTPEIKNSALGNDYIPQGLDRAADGTVYMQAYYYNAGGPTKIFAMDSTGKLIAEYIRKKAVVEDGTITYSDDTSHGAWILATKKQLIVGSAYSIYAYDLTSLPKSGSNVLVTPTSDSNLEALKAWNATVSEDKKLILPILRVDLPINPDLCAYDSDKDIFWVGHYDGSVETTKTRLGKLLGADNINHVSYVFGYKLTDASIISMVDTENEYATPDYILISDLKYIQGVGFTGKRIAISSMVSGQSYLRFYELDWETQGGTMQVNVARTTSVAENKKDVAYYMLDSNNLVKKLAVPTHNECVTEIADDGSMLINFESATSVYIDKTTSETDYIWQINANAMLSNGDPVNTASLTMKSGTVSYISAGNRYMTVGQVDITLSGTAKVLDYIDAEGLKEGGWGVCEANVSLASDAAVTVKDVYMEDASTLTVDGTMTIGNCLLPEYTGVGTVVSDHERTHVERLEPTETENGNIEYWICERENCPNYGVYYIDEAGTTTVESVVILPYPDIYHCLCGNVHSTAAEGGTLSYRDGEGKCMGDCDGAILVWKSWDGTGDLADGSRVYLVADRTTNLLANGIGFDLDLNGYSIQYVGANSPLEKTSGAQTLNICNSSSAISKISGSGAGSDKHGGVISVSTGTVNLYNVHVEANTTGTVKRGGAICVGTEANRTVNFRMYGGTVKGKTASAAGGAICSYSTKDVLFDGVMISGGSAVYGGGNIYVYGHTNGTKVILRDCTVSGGKVTNSGGAGGNIYVNADGACVLENCTVSGGTSASGSGVDLLLKGTLTVRGNVVIKNMSLNGTVAIIDATGLDPESEINIKGHSVARAAEITGNTAARNCFTQINTVYKFDVTVVEEIDRFYVELVNVTASGYGAAKPELTITVEDQTITYGGSIDGTKYTVASGTLVTGDQIVLVPSTAEVTDSGEITAKVYAKDAVGNLVDVTDSYNLTVESGTLIIEEVTVVEIILENIGAETSGAVVTAPEGGWVEGNNTFTVSAEQACAVLVSQDGGVTYERLTATAVTDAENSYSFTVDGVTAETIIAVALAGDANGDGKVTNADSTKIRAVYAGKTTLDALHEMIADANGDGKVTNADSTKIRAVYAGKTELDW